MAAALAASLHWRGPQGRLPLRYLDPAGGVLHHPGPRPPAARSPVLRAGDPREPRSRPPGADRTHLQSQDPAPCESPLSHPSGHAGCHPKQYRKENRALRTETTINNTYDFGIGKRLHNLARLRAVGFAANRRLLDIERLSHDCMLAEDTFQSINGAVTAGEQRASGLRFADPRAHQLLQALILFRQVADGFRCDDLRRHLATLSGRAPGQISQGAITYQLRRLRLHGFVERLPKSFRYRVTEFGLRAALFFTRAYNRLLRPASAAALPGISAVANPLKRAFANLDAELTKWINHAQLAA